MIVYLFIVLATAAGAQTVLLVFVLQSAERARRQAARERDLLINQMCALAGKPWQPAPANERPIVEPRERDLYAVPEQMPDDHDWSIA